MKNLSLKAVVTDATGFYYRSENEWRGLNPQASEWFEHKLGGVLAYINAAPKTGGITATLTGVSDGVQMAPLVVTGISVDELHRFQRMWQRMGDELIAIAEQKAHDKKHKK